MNKTLTFEGRVHLARARKAKVQKIVSVSKKGGNVKEQLFENKVIAFHCVTKLHIKGCAVSFHVRTSITDSFSQAKCHVNIGREKWSVERNFNVESFLNMDMETRLHEKRKLHEEAKQWCETIVSKWKVQLPSRKEE